MRLLEYPGSNTETRMKIKNIGKLMIHKNVVGRNCR